MSLKYIFGLPRSGKTLRCIKEITHSDADNRIYLVPEQFTLQSERLLTAYLSQATTARVLSFQRMAFRLFASTGAPQGTFLDDVGKNMLLRKIVMDLSGELILYGRAADKQGFIFGLSNIFKEFYKYGIRPEHLLELANGVKNSSYSESLAAKFSDLYLIYNKYNLILNERYFMLDSALDLLPGRLSQSGDLAGAHVWIDGFHSFTLQERRVFGSILNIAESVTVTATLNETAVSFNNLRHNDFFFESKHTVNQLTAMAGSQGVKIDSAVLLEDKQSYGDLDFFRKHFFGIRPVSSSSRDEAITILIASDRESEVQSAARFLLEVMRQKNFHYRDAALLTGDLPGYERVIKRVFHSYNIPVFIDIREDILSHPLTELIRAAIDVAVKNWSYESVFRFLRTGLTDIDRHDIDKLENYVLAYGIKGWQWQRDWTYRNNSSETISRIKERVRDALSPFRSAVGGAKRQTVRSFSEDIFSLLDHLSVTQTLENWIKYSDYETEPDYTGKHKQIWGKLTAIFDKLVEILGDTVVTVAEFAKILEAGLSSTDMGMIPPSVDQVIVADLTRSRLPEIKVLIILGANDGLLPKPAPDKSLLSNEERSAFAKNGLELASASDGFRFSMEERFLAYCAISKPSEILRVSYALSDAGKSLKPSKIVTDILRMFPGLKEQTIESDDITAAMPMLNNIGHIIRKHMTGEEMSNVQKDIYGLLKQHPDTSATISKIEYFIKRSETPRKLTERSTRRLYGKELITGVSRLERYAECPFAYFLRYNLRVRERAIFTVSPLDLGNLFHAVLELFCRKLDEKGVKWRDLDEEQIFELTDICLKELSPEMPAFASSARFTYMLERVRRVCRRSVWALTEHIKRGRFEPVSAELNFRNTPLTGINVSLNGERKLILTGRIDRVDICDCNGKRYVKIIDYKSGNVKFSLDDLYYGTQLQLMMYLDAIIKNGKELFENIETELSPGGVFYFNINDPIVSENSPEELLKAFKMTGLLLKDKDLIDSLDSVASKNSGMSEIYPVSVLKSGKISESSSAIDEKSFTELRAYVEDKIISLGNEIVSGKIEAQPYKRGAKTACDYCAFSAVCGIQTKELKTKAGL
ncbi:MAG: helicase-exonuclease AddAB subunit AddB [Clostridiales bacterium]|jgi:ATP-dependent helicase/nuclease subunit B|nr:helicase-exonuclease AddAB subunit AddB [Clostridiales bacterium]